MASTNGVWGIDIGHCALKALRCEYDADNQVLVATGFDYIEHPKILSQPDANPKQLIRDALAQFLERNDLKGDKVALSVPGQNGLARFFQPPPVDMKKLPEIVRFEARQQIPFPLDEVIWDYQLMGGASEVDGFLMEAEVGLFAMKRDQVYEALQPFLEADVEVHFIQLAPLCAYNFVAHNVLTEALESDVYDPDNPPESHVILNVGTDTTDLVVTNGFRVWQRNIPLGGNHFTKQLTKELKLTFAKAEHLKRNVREAEDAKVVIQAMRPVFNDLLTEVQRSIGFFQNIDRRAQIGGIIMMGNAVKLPGLQQYLAKNLGYEIVDVDQSAWASRLTGQDVLSAPQFKDNMHAYGICHGLCLQGLGQARLNTNLLPKEIITQRLIRSKKPWAVATAGALMLAFAVNFFFEYNEWYKVHPTMNRGETTWEQAMSEVSSVNDLSTKYDGEDKQRLQRLEELVALGKELSGNSDRRLLWLELLKAINRALPNNEDLAPTEVPDPKVVPITQRKDLHIEYIESKYLDDLALWFTPPVKRKYLEEIARLEGTLPPTTAEPADALPSLDPLPAPGAPAPAGPRPAGPTPTGPTPGGPTPGGPTPGAPAGPGPAAAPGAGAAPAPGGPAATATTGTAADEGATAAGDATGAAGAGPAAAVPATGVPAAGTAADAADPAAAGEVVGPTGPGWVIELKGYHYYNDDPETWAGTHVRDTLLKNLREQKIQLPTGPGRPPEEFTMKELGIDYVILAVETLIDKNHRIPNPYYEPPTRTPGVGPGMVPTLGGGLGGGLGGLAVPPPTVPATGAAGQDATAPANPQDNPPFFAAPKYTFVVQFCWQERLLNERMRAREQALMQEQLDGASDAQGAVDETAVPPAAATPPVTATGG